MDGQARPRYLSLIRKNDAEAPCGRAVHLRRRLHPSGRRHAGVWERSAAKNRRVLGDVSVSIFVVGSGVTSTLDLGAGDLETVFPGGIASGGSVGSGALLHDLGAVNGTKVLANGAMRVESGGSVSAITVGGSEIVVSGGAYLNESFVTVSSGATISVSTIGQGGNLNLLGQAISTFVYSGAAVTIQSGAVASASVVSGTGFASSATFGSFTVYSTQEVTSGGSAVGTVVGGNGVEQVDSGAADSASILSGGFDVSGTTYANEYVSSGGVASATHVASAGSLIDMGTTVGALVSAGGFMAVHSGGVASNTTLSGGGAGVADEAVYAGGTASGTLIGARGVLNLLGSANATTVGRGGFITISSGGTATATEVTSGGTETVLAGGSAAGTLFDLGGVLDLPFLVYSGGLSGTVDSNDVLSVLQGGNTFVLQLAGSYVGATFGAVKDSGGGTYITVACYCPGTLILTDRGEVPVESLAIGDAVLTLGGAEPIRWIGRRSYAGRFLAGRAHLLPIRIRAGALGHGLPRRELRVSPSHAMFIDGVLVPAGELVDGVAIVQERDCQHVDYIHIELAEHAVIWAEGAPSETFVDDDSRAMFHNATDHAALYPDAPSVPAMFYAERVTDGYALEAIRQRLSLVARKAAA